MSKEPNKTTNHTDAEKVIDIISSQFISMRKAAEIVGILPTTFLSRVKIEGLDEHYARACEARAEAIFDEILEIADDNEGDETVVITEDGIEQKRRDPDNIQRSKLRVDARKWALSKMNPKRFGDKMDFTSDNQPLPAPVIIMPKAASE